MKYRHSHQQTAILPSIYNMALIAYWNYITYIFFVNYLRKPQRFWETRFNLMLLKTSQDVAH
jgi:hypothetical protein